MFVRFRFVLRLGICLVKRDSVLPPFATFRHHLPREQHSPNRRDQAVEHSGLREFPLTTFYHAAMRVLPRGFYHTGQQVILTTAGTL